MQEKRQWQSETLIFKYKSHNVILPLLSVNSRQEFSSTNVKDWHFGCWSAEQNVAHSIWERADLVVAIRVRFEVWNPFSINSTISISAEMSATQELSNNYWQHLQRIMRFEKTIPLTWSPHLHFTQSEFHHTRQTESHSTSNGGSHVGKIVNTVVHWCHSEIGVPTPVVCCRRITCCAVDLNF